MQIGDGRVVSNFIVQALMNEPITIYGDGGQTRSFCYVDDLIDGLMAFMNAPEGIRSPMNIGNPEEFTILELAELILTLTGSRSRLVFLPLPSDDPTQRCPDIGLARQQLGWQPRVPLRQGLQRTIIYFDRLLAAQARPRRRTRRTAKQRLAVAEGSTAVLAIGEPANRVHNEIEARHVRR
jgi:UDP-glucuronate decarboxylase